MEKVETTLGEIRATQHMLATIMEKIQNQLMQDGDPNKTRSVDETPAIFEPIPPQVGPSGEKIEPTILSRTSFQADLKERLRIMREIQHKEFAPISLVTTLTKPIISGVQAPPS